MSEEKQVKKQDDNKLFYQKIVMYKVFDPEEEQMVNQLFLIDVEFDSEAYLEKQPCGCSYGNNIKAHNIVHKPIGLYLVCRIQGTTFGLLPDVVRNKVYPWVKIVKRKKLSTLEAKALFASKKFVATPDIIIHLATR